MERATKIVENLLEFARRSPRDLEDIDIHELLTKTLMLLEKELQANDVRVVTDFQPVPKVTLHLDEMKQVFLNIMLNASQAMPEGGQLRISTRLGRQGGGEPQVEILFEDTGQGIPEDVLADIFNPFFTTKEKGVGLGLSLVYSTMERFGGHIRVDSQVGKGTLVTLRLPPAEGGR